VLASFEYGIREGEADLPPYDTFDVPTIGEVEYYAANKRSANHQYANVYDYLAGNE
jgi:hypothetical protein